MSKLRVLFEAGPMMDAHRTGVGHYVSFLFANLVKYHGDDLDLTGYYFDFLRHNQKKVPELPRTRFQGIWLVPGKLLSLCRRLNFQPHLELFTLKNTDIVIFTNYVSLPTLRHRPTVLLVYDLSFLDHPEYLQRVNLDYLQRFCPPSIRRADLIVTISEFTKRRLLHHFPDLRAEIVITPIPPAERRVEHTTISERLSGLGIRQKKYLLFVGTLEPRKNLQNLVSAYAQLSPDLRQEYSLVLAGGKGWKDTAILDSITTLQQQGYSIIRTGYISEDEKDSLYTNAAAFVMPSHYEGFGMPILEAMQYGIPVACSDIGVFREVAGKAAEYFNKDDIGSISMSLRTLLTNNAYRKQLVRDSAIRLSTFSWQGNSETVYAALQKLPKR